MSDNYRLFQAAQEDLEIFNGQAIIGGGFEFFYDDCEGERSAYEIPGYVSGYVKVYNERLGRVIKTWPTTLSGTNILLLYEQDTTFATNGTYWYEVYYIMSGGYEIRLRFGKLIVK